MVMSGKPITASFLAYSIKKANINKINLQIRSLLPGVCKTYKSIDTVTDPSLALIYPTEFLNSLETQLHNFLLKPGAHILLLRNFDKAAKAV
ncbi:hypothetical protein GDO81_023029 [Engystomops pustulosus]|uniref:ATP-dependent DNA helicase n=1 Tax=Engystomops pustulosus TaxID=76066 RepID=A0AAV6YMU6_ENGPU|nr:hypothetical protein GDO81_023029 [Engystomops pustulosus]